MSVQFVPSVNTLVQSSVVGKVGVNVPVQVSLSLLVIVESVPDVRPCPGPLSMSGIVMSAALENPLTGSEKVNVTVAVSPDLRNLSSIVKVAVGASVSTS